MNREMTPLEQIYEDIEAYLKKHPDVSCLLYTQEHEGKLLALKKFTYKADTDDLFPKYVHNAMRRSFKRYTDKAGIDYNPDIQIFEGYTRQTANLFNKPNEFRNMLLNAAAKSSVKKDKLSNNDNFTPIFIYGIIAIFFLLIIFASHYS